MPVYARPIGRAGGHNGWALTAGPTSSAPVLTPGAFAQLGPAQSKEGTADMLTWAAATPPLVDEYGKIVLWVQYIRQADSTQYHVPLVSNDNAATWTLPTMSGFFDNTNGDIALIRGALCYDTANHLMHGCWALDQTSGGVYYRQYSFTRDGSNNITGVTRTRQMNLEAGVSGMTFESPGATWDATTGKIVLSWGAGNPASAGTKAEVRATCIAPAGAAADVVAANWAAPMNEAAGAGSTDGLGSTGLVKYSCLAKSTTTGQQFHAIKRLASGNLGFVYSATAAAAYKWDQMVKSGSDWRGGLASGALATEGGTTVSLINRSGSGGYSLKHQLTALDQAGSGSVGVGFANWKSNVLGDTWSIVLVDVGTNAVGTITDAYSAGAAHSYAPTGDVAWDATANAWIVTYVKTTTQNSFLKTYDAALGAVQGETALHATTIDIPYVLKGARVGGKTLFLDKDTATRSLPDRFYAYAALGTWS